MISKVINSRYLQYMVPNKKNRSEINIDEDSLTDEPSIAHRFFYSVYAIILGIVLVQVIFFIFNPTGSVILLFDNILFLAFLAVCAILGWFSGVNFIARLKNEIGKFW
ncbi:hypothetical protein DDZ15_05130 [Rhodohalobacter mucosus]|uniref:Uncharacterized protein n=1 Tax=Rhodohalobacter mucosus TaxID=2079485 RepID=A0A316TVM7_9BACT|nr:hypothetical protein DDZ15_05130 [Rhodohalobacter mucosus]